MTIKQITKEIIALLTDMRGPVATRYLMQKFGCDQTKTALDALAAKRLIIRVRGAGAAVELA